VAEAYPLDAAPTASKGDAVTEWQDQLSNWAWATLHQLAKRNALDGDLVSKQGRSELVNAGLAKRVVGKDGFATNCLTPAGFALAATYHHQDNGNRQ